MVRYGLRLGMCVLPLALIWMLGNVNESFGEDSHRTIRALADTVGYARTPEQIEAVVRVCDSLESSRLSRVLTKAGLAQDINWVAGVCPHDDHLYAGQVYYDVMRHVKAQHVILFGVAHRARDFDVDGRLVFDSFTEWRGPYGPVTVSPLRQAIMERLSPADYAVSDNLQAVEHSVEGLIPFLQYYNRHVEIVSILVPYMNWERMDELSSKLAHALSEIISENHLELGSEIALLCSNDCVHYGDQGWGGKNYAPFGTDVEGYRKAVERDQDLIERYLIGKMNAVKLHDLFGQLVDADDIKAYRITWCGRFAVPFGLGCLIRMSEHLERQPVTGCHLGYDTSVAAGELPLRNLGLGTTAPSHFHHWVGYGAIGYW